MNFADYPDTVAEVVAVEPDDHLRGLAKQAAARAAVSVRVVAGHATALPVEDASFDAAVASLVLCSLFGCARGAGRDRAGAETQGRASVF